jgi:hypothetical protein
MPGEGKSTEITHSMGRRPKNNNRAAQFSVDRNSHSGKIKSNFPREKNSDAGPQPGRQKKIGQEA